MFRIVLIVTALTHVPFAMALRTLCTRLGVAGANLIALAIALAAFVIFRYRLPRIASDRSWQFYILDCPVFSHWCASIASAVPIAVCTAADEIIALATGLRSDAWGMAGVGVYGFMFVLSAWGLFIRRRWVRVRRVEIPIADLDPDLDGYRIVQLSDLHIGGITTARTGEKWIRLANAANADLVAVTGDLVATNDDYHTDIARLIGGLRARDGVYVVMGNHDYFGNGETLVTLLRESGACVLRNEGVTLPRGRSNLHVAGVDDSWTGRMDVARALRGRRAGTPTILLAHDPLAFRVAAKLGADLVLAGHTHGGQVAFPFLARALSLSRFTHREHLGLYRHGVSTLYVHPGLGTTGPPIRLGVAPEITVLTLRRQTSSAVASLTTSIEPIVSMDEPAVASAGTGTTS